MADTNIVINVGSWQAVGLGGTVLVGAWWIGNHFGSLKEAVRQFGERLTNLEGRVDLAFKSSSPLTLLPKGEKILNESNLKKWIDDRKDHLIDRCKAEGSTSNPYDIQTAAFRIFDEIDFGDFEAELKTAAYNAGVPMNIVRRIGGIYFRDVCLQEHGYDKKSLDEK